MQNTGCKLLTYLLTHSMEQSPSWEANQFSASQGIPRILWNLKVYYHIQKYPSPVSILSQLDPVHTPTSHFLKIHLNIILPSMPGSPKWSLFLRFPHQNPVYASPPCVLHAPPISFFSIFSPKQYRSGFKLQVLIFSCKHLSFPPSPTQNKWKEQILNAAAQEWP